MPVSSALRIVLVSGGPPGWTVWVVEEGAWKKAAPVVCEPDWRVEAETSV